MKGCMFHRCKRGLWMLIPLLWIPASAAQDGDAQALLARMESAYQTVKDYRMQVQLILASENAGQRKEEFIYTFKKPGRVRMDFQSPQPGTRVIFPDEEGKVWVRPWGWRFLDLHLAPDSLFLSNPWGQRVDQSDFGLLIQNIGRSMGGERQGPLEILEEERDVRIRVLARNHFRKGKITRYEFVIDASTFLPAEIEERTPEGVFERRITFRNLMINTGVPDSFFQP